jgi:dipeptidyl-peptidase 4
VKRCAPRRLARPALFVLLSLLATGCLAPPPARRAPTADELLGKQPINWFGRWPRNLEWDPAGGTYLERREGVLQRVDPRTEQGTPVYDVAPIEAALAADADIGAEAAKNLARNPALHTRDYAVLVFEHQDRLWAWHAPAGELRRLTDAPLPGRTEQTLSPAGNALAYRREHEIYALDTQTGATTRLTTDGSETLLNGQLDWVYQEEIYGRGKWRAYWWSEDGQQLAYLQLDTSAEPVYPIVDYLPTHPTTTGLRFPKAGDPNAKIRLGVVPVGGGATHWLDLDAYRDSDILIVNVTWAPDGRLIFAVQDRESRWLELNAAEWPSGAIRRLLREESETWVDFEKPPCWLKDGTFLWQSARDGWLHVYHHDRDGRPLGQVTSGPWEARDIKGVDERRGVVYVAGTLDSPAETHLYRVPLAGGAPVRLTEPGSTHGVALDPQCEFFFDTYSNVQTPPRMTLRDSDGRALRVISDNPVAAFDKYDVCRPELLRVPTPAGYGLNAIIVRPPHYAPNRTYPVFCLVYGGPRMPSVRNSFPHEFGWYQWLAQQGIIVWVCDPHSASCEGVASGALCYQELGKSEVADLEASLRWLAAHEPADLGRVGIYGHSYGGFYAAYALTHSKMFCMGIAASALTDWRNYDSIYTEKYMRTPAHNPAGYDVASVLKGAGNLHGRLLIAHGMVDDNVHVQNAMELIDALLKAGQTFDLAIYPRDDHGLWHYGESWQATKLRFIRETLLKP